jgi:hypothetical protein
MTIAAAAIHPVLQDFDAQARYLREYEEWLDRMEATDYADALTTDRLPRNPQAWGCPVCDMRFGSNAAAWRHIDRNHT